MLSLDELKQRYNADWVKSNARERFVLLYLKVYLPPVFEPRLTGLGAGSSEYIPRSYRGAGEAFDITIYFNGLPVAYVEVTGLDYDKRPKKGLGYCVGEWKIDKAYKHRLQDRTWVAYVLETQSRILWAPITKFLTSLAKLGKLYEDERPHRCLPIQKWHPFYKPDWKTGPIPFLNWLTAKAATEGPIIVKGAARG